MRYQVEWTLSDKPNPAYGRQVVSTTRGKMVFDDQDEALTHAHRVANELIVDDHIESVQWEVITIA